MGLFSDRDIQKAAESANHQGLGGYMFADPCGRGPARQRRRRSSSKNQDRCSIESSRSSHSRKSSRRSRRTCSRR
ncbi:CotG/ExsB N-terminal domain-containing protein, partial [Mesobacillus zeae]|uniref:CotG/ExsB N-terminal domain-containing protein n=1 Tax=Mesobacillus zeae TaxID=1917180 RepID=UPI003AB906B6